MISAVLMAPQGNNMAPQGNNTAPVRRANQCQQRGPACVAKHPTTKPGTSAVTMKSTETGRPLAKNAVVHRLGPIFLTMKLVALIKWNLKLQGERTIFKCKSVLDMNHFLTQVFCGNITLSNKVHVIVIQKMLKQSSILRIVISGGI